MVRVVRGKDGKVLGVTGTEEPIAREDFEQWEDFVNEVGRVLLSRLPVDVESASAVKWLRKDDERIKQLQAPILTDAML